MIREISEGKKTLNTLYWNLVIMIKGKHFYGYQNHESCSVKINLYFNI